MAQEKPYRYGKDDKSKTILVIGILLVLIVVIGGALLLLISGKMPSVQLPPSQTNQTKPPPVNLTNNTPVTTTCDDQCLLGRAQTEQNISECQIISSGPTQQDCFASLSTVSIDACKALTNQTKKNNCITTFAVSQKDMSLCDGLTDAKAACQLAVDPCFNSTNMNLCTAERDKTPSDCQSDTNCLLNYSVTMKDPNSCGLITDPITAKACESSVSYNDQCTDLPLQAQRDLCYQMYATYTNNYLECTQITPETNYSLGCFSYFAAKFQNQSICDYFSLDQKWSCLITYSLSTGDLSGCMNIDPLASTNRFQCVFQYALKFGKPSACQLILGTLGTRDTCYQGAIIYSPQNLTWQDCGNVTDFVWSNACYTQGAKLNNNVSICDHITADFAKQSCQDSYAAYKANH